MEIMKRLVREEEGQGMVEYGLILGLISVGAIASLKIIGPVVVKYFADAATEIKK